MPGKSKLDLPGDTIHKWIARALNMQTVKRLYAILLVSMLAVAGIAYAAESTLELNLGSAPYHIPRNALLFNPATRTIDVPNDVAYHRSMHYRALPLATLLGNLAPDASVQFTATDGFVANIPAKLLLAGGQPWLAIESDDTWPPLKADGPSAGPFYLVWLKPEQGGVSPEQWPYQIAKISVVLPLESRYPQIVPKTASAAEQRGLHVYIANCASCHSINGGGDAAVGPDLNRPYSPTEYFQESFLRKLVRNPAAVRTWGQRIMPGFSADVLSDAQLDDLLAYLQHMAKQRE
ncbi:MAG TPA: cytochrome c [Burkholderiaceae bacterium]|jgi:mono/diheme cytochrome c family protein|nr:cytochrome c [Burkholderiaceae bacterium]